MRESILGILKTHAAYRSWKRLTLPELMSRLPRVPTLGEFHDELRRLHRDRVIRLGPWTECLASIQDATNALYLDREVKFFVELY
jgi:hypothetical protein